MFLYRILPYHIKENFLTQDSLRELDRINDVFNANAYSEERALNYDSLHLYKQDKHLDYPAEFLIDQFANNSYLGTSVDIGAGSGFFTVLIAKRSEKVIAIEPVLDFRDIILNRLKKENISNVDLKTISVFDIDKFVKKDSVDTIFLIRTLHHLHRRTKIFKMLHSLLKPKGKLFLVEPSHNLERILKLSFRFLKEARNSKNFKQFYEEKHNWATHDFLTQREFIFLAKNCGFKTIKVCSYWIPFVRYLSPTPMSRFKIENILGRMPFLSCFGRVLFFLASKS